MTTLDKATLDAIAAAVAAIYAPAEPVASAPAEPVAASPFAAIGLADASGKAVRADNRPDVIREAAASAPDGKRDEWARQAARIHRPAGFACTESVTINGQTIAAHGYAFAGKVGEPCKSPACSGTIA